MIDFAKITKTLDGYDCHYFGTRESYGTTLHCFGVMTPSGVMEKCYDSQGRQLIWMHSISEWEAAKVQDTFQIVKPKKKVSVTRWITIKKASVTESGYYLEICENKDYLPQGCSEPQKHTFTFEVDE